jgi:hypothetical protein
MAEFLILNKTNSNIDPDKDKYCYKRGDIVEVREDGASYGSKEGLPDFIVLRVTGYTKEQVLKFIEYHSTDGTLNGIQHRRRYALLPSECDAIEAAGGFMEIRKNKLNGKYVDKAA